MRGKDIENLVIVKLEEYSPYNPSTDGPLLSGGDLLDEVKPIYAYISQHLSEAADEILRIAPISKLHPVICSNLPIEDDNDNTIGKVKLPMNYLRIHTFKMEGWRIPVHIAYSIGSIEYTRQHYRWTRGNFVKPVVTEDGCLGITLHDTDVKKVYLTEKSTFDEAIAYILDDVIDDSGIGTISFYVSTAGNVFYDCTMTTSSAQYVEYEDVRYYRYPTGDTFSGGRNQYCWRSKAQHDYYTSDEHPEGEKTEISYVIDFKNSVGKIDNRYLYYYSTRGDHYVEKFLYIPSFSNEQEYEEVIAELIALNCAKKVCEVFERSESLAIINKELQEVMQNISL